MPEFPVGSRVVKESGDYMFRGWVVSTFQKRSGAPRYVVENADGILMIMAPHQLKLYEDKNEKRNTPSADPGKPYRGSLYTGDNRNKRR